MKRLREQFRLGLRWLSCGWRLCRRRLWLTLTMGLISSLIINLLSLIPIAGNILLSLLLPLLASSTLLTLDDIANQRASKSIGMAAKLLRPLQELFRIFREQKHLMTVVIICIYSLTITILITISLYIVSGGSWIIDISAMGLSTLLRAMGTWLLAIILYTGLIASLFFALPLIFLRDKALAPSIGNSLKMSQRYLFAILVLIAAVILVFLIGAIVAVFSQAAAFAVWVIGIMLAFPLFMASAYCSYRTLYPKK